MISCPITIHLNPYKKGLVSLKMGKGEEYHYAAFYLRMGLFWITSMISSWVNVSYSMSALANRCNSSMCFVKTSRARPSASYNNERKRNCQLDAFELSLYYLTITNDLISASISCFVSLLKNCMASSS